MATLSLSMIVRNEERTIGRVLACARSFCDQMVVVDTGSDDQTVRIARDSGAEVHHQAWTQDFSAARNFALSRCTGEWMIWLDADDVVTPSACRAISGLKHSVLNEPSLHKVLASYHLTWDEAGRPVDRFDRERLVRRSEHIRWVGPVHEMLVNVPPGSVQAADVFVEHRPHPDNMARKKGRNLAIFERWINVGDTSPHLMYQYGCELHWSDRYLEAARAFESYLSRVRDTEDITGEQYLALIKAGECCSMAGELGRGLAHLESAMVLDPRRAEAATMAGELYQHMGRLREAEARLTFAAGLEVPPYDGRYVYPWFYGERPRQALAQVRAFGSE